jgi:Protein of unknown function (DUF2804)
LTDQSIWSVLRAVATLPIRGVGLRPARLPPLRRGRPLKRWRYVAVYGPELMLCVGHARIAGIPQRWWAVALPDGQLFEGRNPDGVIDIALDEGPGVEVLSPHGRSWIWTRKQAGIHVSGSVRVDGREHRLDGPLGFVDESAGYHARRTTWRWSAGIGTARDGRAVAWNLVDGVHDAPTASERTVWVDGEPHEVDPQAFAGDLSAVGDMRFSEWSAREDHTNLLLVRSDYRQPFGAFSGSLPGGVELDSGYGVMEWHDVRW